MLLIYLATANNIVLLGEAISPVQEECYNSCEVCFENEKQTQIEKKLPEFQDQYIGSFQDSATVGAIVVSVIKARIIW